MPIAAKYLKVLRSMSSQYCDISKYGEDGRIDDTIQGVKTCKKSRGVFYAKMKKEGIDYRRELSSHSRTKCFNCNKPPTVDVLWANGKARCWFCDKHFEQWKLEENDMSDTGTNEGDIDKVHKVKDGIVPEKWKDWSKLSNGPSPDVEAIKPKVIAKEPTAGLILVYPHGTMLVKGTKKAVVKPRKLEKHIGEIVHIVEGDFSIGKARLEKPRQIKNLEEFNKLFKTHMIAPEERTAWCKKYKSWCKFPLYLYPVKLISKFPKPVPIRRPKGAQVWIESVKLIPKLSLGKLLVYHAEVHSNPPDCLCSDQHTNIMNELESRGYAHLIHSYNLQDRISELIKDWKTYVPAKTDDAVLRDDWRIVNSWWKTLLSKGRKMKSKQFIDYSLEEQKKIVKGLMRAIRKEMVKRGWEPGELSFKLPGDMQIADIDIPYVKELKDNELEDLHQWVHIQYKDKGLTEDIYNADVFIMTEMYKRGMIDEGYEDKDELDVKTRYAWQEYPLPGKLAEPTGEEITLEQVLEAFRNVGLIPVKGQPFASYLSGRIVNLGKIPKTHDIDIVFRQEYDPRIVIALKKIKPEWLAKRLHPVFDPSGPGIGFSVSLHGYALNPLPQELQIKGYGPYRQSLAKEVKVGKPVVNLKPKSGFSKFEFWDTKESWSTWGADNIKAGLYIEEKLDGRTFQFHMDKAKGIFKLFTEDRQRDRAGAMPEIIDELKKLKARNVILNGEIVVYTLPGKITAKNARTKRTVGELVPREDTASLTIGTVPEEIKKGMVYVIYDVLYLDDKQLSSLGYKERRAIYEKLIPGNLQYIDTVRGEVAGDMRSYFRLVSKYRSIKGSEGVVIKRSDSIFPIKYSGENRTSQWIKIKNLKEIDVKILGIVQKKTKAGKPLPTWMYESFFLLPKEKAKDWYPGDIKEHEGKVYARIGMAYGTGRKAKIGDIITVMPIRLREYEKKGKRRVTWMFPYFKEIKTDKKEADTLTTVERLIKLGTGPAPSQKAIKSLSDSEFQEWLDFPREKTITIKLEECPYWNYLNACPWRAKFHTSKTPQYLTVFKMEQLRFPVDCPLAFHFKCHWIKDYYYQVKTFKI